VAGLIPSKVELRICTQASKMQNLRVRNLIVTNLALRACRSYFSLPSEMGSTSLIATRNNAVDFPDLQLDPYLSPKSDPHKTNPFSATSVTQRDTCTMVMAPVPSYRRHLEMIR
jgi:hypothetical protein